MKRTRWPKGNVVQLNAVGTKKQGIRRTIGLTFFVDDAPLNRREKALCEQLLQVPFGRRAVHVGELQKLVLVIDRLLFESDSVMLIEPEILEECDGGGPRLRQVKGTKGWRR